MTFFSGDQVKQRLGLIGARLAIIDSLLLALISERMRLAGQVAWTKSRRRDDQYPNGEPISRPEIEAIRLDAIAKKATDYGVDPNLARTILSILIDHSCKQQMILWQNHSYDHGEFTDEELAQNLSELARLAALNYGEYSRRFPATAMTKRYEREVILREIGALDYRTQCLDLGCATGELTIELAGYFDKIIGVDSSIEMIDRARSQSSRQGNERFEVDDFGLASFWQTIPDGSIDLIVMGLGTASAVRDIELLMSRIDHALRPGGRFVLSFCNAEASVTSWGFSPWASSLAATFDGQRNCVDVRIGDRVLSVFARAYTADQLDDLTRRHLQILETVSYPTIAAILPREILDHPVVGPSIELIDRGEAHAPRSLGAYLIATGRRS
jgi:SAM-dependent methyltransferase